MTAYKIIYISDFALGEIKNGVASARSGYSGIGMALCEELQKMGHEVKVLGLGYTGQEHQGTFSLIPCNNLQDAAGTMNNLKFFWQPDAVIVALDINHFQEQFFPLAKQLSIPYICITPLESEPLTISWANLLMQMDKVFFISEFGAAEARKEGVEAEHIRIGIDTEAWRLRTEEEYKAVRNTLGFDEDDFVILTVADNQERKNLSRGMEIVSQLKKLHAVNAKHILVTRENSMVGWKLYDLAMRLGISSDLRVFNSGMPFKDLYALYAASDAFLLCSKGEGLGLPVMESMACGVPVVANKVGAIPELLGETRGWVIEPDYMMIDPFGNQNRYFINTNAAVEALLSVKNEKIMRDTIIENARIYIHGFTWDIPAKQVENAIKEIVEKISKEK